MKFGSFPLEDARGGVAVVRVQDLNRKLNWPQRYLLRPVY